MTIQRLEAEGEIDADRYEVATMSETRKEDVRRNDDDAQSNVVRVTARLVRAPVDVHRGDWYVPLAQPLANMIVAALEPETQSSYAANRLLSLPSTAGSGIFLPLYRVRTHMRLPVIEWNGAE